MELCRLLTITGVLVTVLFFRIKVVTSSCPGSSFEIHSQCYVILDSRYEWEEAKEECRQRNGRLPEITTQEEAEALREYCERDNTGSVWLEYTRSNREWFWLASDETLSSQGCYSDSSSDRDLPHRVDLSRDDVTIDRCIRECRELEYEYAGLQYGDECYCGNSYGRYGLRSSTSTSYCTQPCTGDEEQVCGGRRSNSIYKVDGAYGGWAMYQPNDWSDHQDCGALGTLDHEYKLEDENCYEYYYYICDLPCPGNQDQICNYVSDLKVTWFEAKMKCVEMGGQLTTIQNAFRHAELSEFLLTNGHSDEKHWLGLARAEWVDSQGTPLTFTDFANESPDDPDDLCVMMSRYDDYHWDDVACHRRQYVMCHIGHAGSTTLRTTPEPIIATRRTTTPEPIILPLQPSSTTSTPADSNQGNPGEVTSAGSSTGMTSEVSTNHMAANASATISIGYNSTENPDVITKEESTGGGGQNGAVLDSSEGGDDENSDFFEFTLFHILLLSILLFLAIAIITCTVAFFVFKSRHRTNQITDTDASPANHRPSTAAMATPIDLYKQDPVDHHSARIKHRTYKDSMRKLTDYPYEDGSTC